LQKFANFKTQSLKVSNFFFIIFLVYFIFLSNFQTNQHLDLLFSGLLNQEKLETLHLDFSGLKLSKKSHIKEIFENFLSYFKSLKYLHLNFSGFLMNFFILIFLFEKLFWFFERIKDENA